MGRRGLLGAIALLLIGVAIGVTGTQVWGRWRDDGDDPTREMRLTVSRRLGDQTISMQPEATCAVSSAPDRQAVVLDAEGATVAAVWPDNGTTRQGADGNWYCDWHGTLMVPVSPWYEFEMAGMPGRWVSADELAETGSEVTVGWPEGPLMPATPEASPMARAGVLRGA